MEKMEKARSSSIARRSKRNSLPPLSPLPASGFWVESEKREGAPVSFRTRTEKGDEQKEGKVRDGKKAL